VKVEPVEGVAGGVNLCDTPVSPRVSLEVLTHEPLSYVNQS
jgi:hypothetical protein